MQYRTLMGIFSLLVVVFVAAGCRPVTAPAGAPAADPAAAPTEAPMDSAATEQGGQEAFGIANPASVYCEQQGGKLEIRDETDGQVGYCTFDDGSECEEWAYLRGACAPGEAQASTSIGMPNPASVHCKDEGGTLEMRQDTGGEYGMCVFADGTECEEWAFFRGECAPGQTQPAANMPNPASVNCTEQSGTLEMRQDASGGEYGMCVFADNTECEEWALLRGTCSPGDNPVSK